MLKFPYTTVIPKNTLLNKYNLRYNSYFIKNLNSLVVKGGVQDF